jgi:calcium-dependent protein kinase
MGACVGHHRNTHRPDERKPSELQKFAKQSIQNFYRFGKILGSGSFGTVKIGYNLIEEKTG